MVPVSTGSRHGQGDGVKRPLRKVGTAVVVLMTILLANITYIQVVKSDAYRQDPNNTRTLLEEYNRQRGQIVAAGGVVLARSDPSTGQYRYQRVYPGGATYANLTGFYSLRYGPTGLERTYNDVLSGDDPDLIVDRLSDLITGRDPRGGNVELTVVPAVQKAAYQGLTSRGYVGAVVAHPAEDRRDPGDGHHRRRSTRTRWPATPRRPSARPTTRWSPRPTRTPRHRC